MFRGLGSWLGLEQPVKEAAEEEVEEKKPEEEQEEKEEKVVEAQNEVNKQQQPPDDNHGAEQEREESRERSPGFGGETPHCWLTEYHCVYNLTQGWQVSSWHAVSVRGKAQCFL